MKNPESTENADRDGHGRWDRWGSLASSACAVHCMVSPLLFLALPTFAEFWAHPASHALMALAVVPLALTVIFRGYKKHRVRWVPIAAAFGIVCVLVGSALPYLESNEAVAAKEEGTACTSCCPSVVTTEDGSSRLKLPPAALVTILGSVFLVSAHIGNRRSCQSCTPV